LRNERQVCAIWQQQRQAASLFNRRDLFLIGADHVVVASSDAGIDVGLPNAVKAMYDRAIAAGHGADGWPSLYEVIKKSLR